MPASKQSTDEFLRLARERFKLASEAEQETREQALDDFRFRAGEQWPDNVKNKRKDRVMITVNRIPRTIAQVTNEQRQQRPSGQINPVGDGADKETAEILQGIIRHIEVNSDAEIAYDMAFDHMVTGGLGYFRIITDWPDDDSDDQEIYIIPVEDPFSVVGDPFETIKRPADYYFIFTDMGKESYKQEFSDSDLSKVDDQAWAALGNQAPGWIKTDGVRVAEYFYVEITKGKRKPIRKVKWAKINGIEILEESEWLVDEIPIFRVVGEELTIDGKKHIAGLTRHAKDPARMYNFWVSAATEMIALAPKPKYIAAAGQVEQFQSQWERANQSDIGVLTYNPMDVAGIAVPPPKLEVFEPPVQAINMMTRQSDNDFKATTGIYDASLGEKGPDESGKAILARQKQTDIAILNFSDNLSRTMRRELRHLLKLIPKVYQERQIVRIIKPDGESEMVPVNGAQPTPKDPQNLAAGMKKVFDIRTGRYDVTVSVGPSYQTKRQESVATQLELAKSFPVVAQAAPDLMIRNMDIPQSNEIADRVKLLLPPAILQAEDQNQVPQLHAQLQHATQQVELLSKVNEELLKKAQGHEAEAQAKIQIEQLKQQTAMSKAELDAYVKITVAEISTKAQNQQTRATLESEELQNIHDSAHEVGMQAQEHANQMQLAEKQHQQSLEQAEQGQQHALEQGDQSGQQQTQLAQMAQENQGAGQ